MGAAVKNHGKNGRPNRLQRRSTRQRYCRAALRLALPLAVGALAWPATARATNDVWTNNTSGLFNWSPGAWSNGLPQNGYSVFINFTGQLFGHSISYNAASGLGYAQLLVDDTGSKLTSHSASLLDSSVIFGATVESAGDSTQVAGGSFGVGNIFLSGTAVNPVGTLTLGAALTDSGMYSLTDTAYIDSNFEYVGFGGSGVFNQSGGTNTVNFSLLVGYASTSNGTYNLSAGILTTNLTEVGSGGPGTFVQSGGTHAITTYLNVGSQFGNGTYSFNGAGVLSGTLERVGYVNLGTFIQSAGSNETATLTVGDQTSSSGLYSLSGTGTIGLLPPGGVGQSVAGVEHIGVLGTGTFIQSGGSNVATALTLGDNTNANGTYSLSDTGVLSVLSENVGNGGNGNFLQSGGNHFIAADLSVGRSNTAGSFLGVYSLSGSGLLSVNGNEYIGTSGPGLFVQTGGTNTLTGSGSSIAVFGTGDGTIVYNLSAGTASAPGASVQSGVLAISGSGSFTVANSLFLSDATGTAVTVSGGSLSVGTLDNSGSFSQTGGSFTITSTLTQSEGHVTLGGPQTLYSIPTVSISGGTTKLTTDAQKVLVTSNLSITGLGLLDLTTNSLIMHANASTLPSKYSSLQSLISFGTLRTSSGTIATTLGLLKASDYLALNGPAATFAGQSLATTDILVKYTYVGDTNLDGKITVADYARLDDGFLFHLTPSWFTGDFNYDGHINYLDYAAIDAGLSAYQGNGPLAQSEIAQHAAEFGAPYLAALQADLAPVPEPSTLLLLSLPLLTTLRRRRPAP